MSQHSASASVVPGVGLWILLCRVMEKYKLLALEVLIKNPCMTVTILSHTNTDISTVGIW